MARKWTTSTTWLFDVIVIVIVTVITIVVVAAAAAAAAAGAVTTVEAVVPPRTRISWVNGIGYSIDHIRKEKKEISKLFGGKKVWYCFNPTSMSHDDDLVGYLGDLTQAGTQKLGRITDEVNALVKHLKNLVAIVGRNGLVIHIAHSQGALVTALATRQLSAVEMSHIEVIAFGGAAALRRTSDTPFRRCINYYSVNDPLLFVVPSAEHALRSGFVGDDEFCFLAPRVGDPVADHHLLAPTYAQALSWEGQRYQQLYRSYLVRLLYPILCLVNYIIRILKGFIKTHIAEPLLAWWLLYVKSKNSKNQSPVQVG